MSKLLQTQLPFAADSVDPELFNRLVRILEINLGAIDLDNVRQISDPEKNTLKFNDGSIIWNTTVGVLQVYTGNQWIDIGERTLEQGFEMTTSVGKVTIKIAGSTIITL